MWNTAGTVRRYLVWVAAALAALTLPHAVAARSQANTWAGTWHNAAPADGSFWVFTGSASSASGLWKGSAASGTLSGSMGGDGILRGTFRNNEANLSGSFELRLAADGRTFSGTWRHTVDPAGTNRSWTAQCSAGACLQNGRAPTTTGSDTRGGLPLRGLVVVGEVEVIRAGGGTEPLTSTTLLRSGDRLVTGMDSSVQVALPDGSVVVVRELTDIQLQELTAGKDAVRTRLWLKAGEVSADVKPRRAATADFSCRLPTAMCGVRGTSFSLFADPVGRLSVVSVRRGVVEVDPIAAGPATTRVAAGREVLVTATTSIAGARGKTGAVGGVGPARAYGLVLAHVKRAKGACGLKPASGTPFALRTVASQGWEVALRLTGGVSGTATWLVSGAGVKPTNALATRIGRGCG